VTAHLPQRLTLPMHNDSCDQQAGPPVTLIACVLILHATSRFLRESAGLARHDTRTVGARRGHVVAVRTVAGPERLALPRVNRRVIHGHSSAVPAGRADWTQSPLNGTRTRE